jgi:hypothetical protein
MPVREAVNSAADFYEALAIRLRDKMPAAISSGLQVQAAPLEWAPCLN